MPGGRPPIPPEIKAAQGTLRPHREAKGSDAPLLTAAPVAPARFSARDFAIEAGASAFPAPTTSAEIVVRRSNQQRMVARETWDCLTGILIEWGVLRQSDLLALEILCWEFGRWRMLSGVLEEEGATYERQDEDGAVIIKPHPAVAQMDRAFANAERLMGRFGLTPSDRARVRAAATAGAKETDPFAAFRGPRGVIGGKGA